MKPPMCYTKFLLQGDSCHVYCPWWDAESMTFFFFFFLRKNKPLLLRTSQVGLYYIRNGKRYSISTNKIRKGAKTNTSKEVRHHILLTRDMVAHATSTIGQQALLISWMTIASGPSKEGSPIAWITLLASDPN